jgi:hypothetical protein
VDAVAEQGLHAEGADEANNGGEGKDIEMEGHEKAKSQDQEEL